jgi:hypothetical protein
MEEFMKKAVFLALAVAAIASAQGSFAYQPSSAATSVRMVPASTMLTITPVNEITSKRIAEGDKFQFILLNDVVENGVVAIQRGTNVQGVISYKTGRAIGGKSGKFEVTFDQITVNGKSYKLTGMHRQEGRGNSVGALLGSMFVTGRSAVMIPGQTATAMTAEPIPY